MVVVAKAERKIKKDYTLCVARDSLCQPGFPLEVPVCRTSGGGELGMGILGYHILVGIHRLLTLLQVQAYALASNHSRHRPSVPVQSVRLLRYAYTILLSWCSVDTILDLHWQVAACLLDCLLASLVDISFLPGGGQSCEDKIVVACINDPPPSLVATSRKAHVGGRGGRGGEGALKERRDRGRCMSGSGGLAPRVVGGIRLVPSGFCFLV